MGLLKWINCSRSASDILRFSGDCQRTQGDQHMCLKTKFTTIVAIGLIAAARAVNSAGYTFTIIDVPGAFQTVPSGINNLGSIVGNNVTEGFLYIGGSYTPINVPGASLTVANGINDAGQIVGAFTRTSASDRRPFIETGGTFTIIDVPGTTLQGASGVNNAGQVVGEFFDS